jgi:hypothetical protein
MLAKGPGVDVRLTLGSTLNIFCAILRCFSHVTVYQSLIQEYRRLQFGTKFWTYGFSSQQIRAVEVL